MEICYELRVKFRLTSMSCLRSIVSRTGSRTTLCMNYLQATARTTRTPISKCSQRPPWGQSELHMSHEVTYQGRSWPFTTYEEVSKYSHIISTSVSHLSLTGRTFYCSLYTLFPARVPENGTQEFTDLLKHINVEPGDGRSAGKQAGYQMAALGTTLVFAIVGGIITGSYLWCHHFSIPWEEKCQMTAAEVGFGIGS